MMKFLYQKGCELKVFAYENVQGIKEYKNERFAIAKYSFPERKDNKLTKLIKYLRFNLAIVLGLLKVRPDVILYYEPYSAVPVYWYLKLFKPDARLFIHYHEYYPPEHFLDKGMEVARLGNKCERKYLYDKAEWISYTNEERMVLFLKDNPGVSSVKVRAMPNYPPEVWKGRIEEKVTDKRGGDGVYRCVYAGALSFHDTYIKEFCKWVLRQAGKVQFDIYSFNAQPEVEEYLEGLKSTQINYFRGGVEYNTLPRILSNYDAGLVLYKCNTVNYVWNVPNKVYEYLVCGLDVWFPREMEGAKSLKREDAYPKVIEVDFKALGDYNLEQLFSREGLEYKPYSFSCEEVYEELWEEMCKRGKGTGDRG
ncbi:MAG: hypothetical protein GF392_01755 [Candidatus Omnitrophica bacterium]|nr:hypothetical protein [Candidatus Omnitrophota bacterium]